MTRQHRYRQEALGEIPGAEAHDYSPKELELAQPAEQGQLALDGSVLGPLFDQPAEQGQQTTNKGVPNLNARWTRYNRPDTGRGEQ